MVFPEGGRLRLVLIAVLTIGLGACVAIERPRVGPGPPVLAPTKVRALGLAPYTGEAARFAFLPITGAPAEMLFRMEDKVKEQAASRRLTLVAEDDPTVTYVVKGYLSAVGDANGALMVYVWDVFDTSGTRLHRVSGQEPAPGSGADPWAGVTVSVIDTAARETIDALADWTRG